MVACCPSELWMAISPSFRHVRDQLPTVSLVGPTTERMGWLAVTGFTWLLARCSFSKNSLRDSEETDESHEVSRIQQPGFSSRLAPRI